jgi:hypothetical protein
VRRSTVLDERVESYGRSTVHMCYFRLSDPDDLGEISATDSRNLRFRSATAVTI